MKGSHFSMTSYEGFLGSVLPADSSLRSQLAQSCLLFAAPERVLMLLPPHGTVRA